MWGIHAGGFAWQRKEVSGRRSGDRDAHALRGCCACRSQKDEHVPSFYFKGMFVLNSHMHPVSFSPQVAWLDSIYSMGSMFEIVRTDGWTDGWTVGRMDGRTDGRTEYRFLVRAVDMSLSPCLAPNRVRGWG